jgi:predicted amino acid dehydrogenase
LTKFAFVIHPIQAKDAAKKYPFLKWLPDPAIELFMKRRKPVLMSEVKGIRSITGAETEGWFIGLPMTPSMLTNPANLDFAYDQIVRCTEMAAELGAQVIGLGAFSSVVGDGGVTVAKRSPIAVTTGNSYTVATAIQGGLEACTRVGVIPVESRLGIVGAGGSIGKTCSQILAPQFAETVLIGRNLEKTEALAADLPRATASTNPADLVNCDLVITVSSAAEAIVLPEHLKQGAIVVDVARPRDVSVRVAKERPDVLVIEGGVVSVPGDPQFGTTFGFPPKTAYACMSETFMLALEDRPESFTLGKDVSTDQVLEMNRLADKHGFHIAGFRSFERAVDDISIQRAKAARAQAASVSSKSYAQR